VKNKLSRNKSSIAVLQDGVSKFFVGMFMSTKTPKENVFLVEVPSSPTASCARAYVINLGFKLLPLMNNRGTVRVGVFGSTFFFVLKQKNNDYAVIFLVVTRHFRTTGW